MDKLGTETMLKFMKDSLPSLYPVEINKAIVSTYTRALANYSPAAVIPAVEELCSRWEHRYLPSAATIADLCSHKQGDPSEDSYYKNKRVHDDQEYKKMKDTYKTETFEFRKALLNGATLSEVHEAAKKQCDIYIGYSIGERCLVDEIRKGKTPFTICYFAHFREFLAGVLPELTGIPKGNVSVAPKKPKVYDEEYFKNFNFNEM
jgi:hypothetical protein